MMLTRLAGLALVFLLAAPAALAEPSTDELRAAFAQADRNDDGSVDREEFHLRLVEIYFFVDLDKDGYIEPEELAEVEVIEQDLALTDRNRDGRISLHEFVEARFEFYRHADTDDNGRLTIEETVAFAALEASGT